MLSPHPYPYPTPTRHPHPNPNAKVREELVPRLSEPVWSGYTCFAAIAQCVPDDIKDVGYKVLRGSLTLTPTLTLTLTLTWARRSSTAA